MITSTSEMEQNKMKASEITKKLIELGCKEWKKSGSHRIYLDGVDAKMLLNNCHAHFGKTHTVFFDVIAGNFVSSNKRISENLNILSNEN